MKSTQIIKQDRKDILKVVIYINKNQLLVAKSIYDKLGRQIRCSDCVISSRFNILKVLIELGIPIKEKDGSDRPLIDIYDELGRKIRFIEARLKNKLNNPVIWEVIIIVILVNGKRF